MRSRTLCGVCLCALLAGAVMFWRWRSSAPGAAEDVTSWPDSVIVSQFRQAALLLDQEKPQHAQSLLREAMNNPSPRSLSSKIDSLQSSKDLLDIIDDLAASLPDR